MKRMSSAGIKFSAGLALVGLAACSGSGTSPQSPSTTANVLSSTLQFNVGTANLFGDVPAVASAGTNFVVTYRQVTGQTAPGASAVDVSSPSITIPGTLPATAGTTGSFSATIATGPSAAEVGTHVMGSTVQTGGPASTFGIAGGAFGLGIEPYNFGIAGVADTLVPYSLPLYDSTPSDPNKFLPVGGLPAFDPSGNAAAAAGAKGVALGLDVFKLTPTVGTYTLGVSIPANTGAITTSAAAAMTSATLLPAVAPATPTVIASAGSAASSSLSLAVVIPAGVTEAYVQVTDIGPTAADGASCLGAAPSTPKFYTVLVRASGTVTLPAGAICTAADNNTAGGTTDSDGDEFLVETIGFDYPAYEISYPSSLGNSAPSIAGSSATKQSDITVSHTAIYTLPASGVPTLALTHPTITAGTRSTGQ